MSLPATIKHHLDASGVKYAVVSREALNGEARTLPTRMAKSVVLQDRDGLMIAVIAAGAALDLDALQKQAGQKIDLVPPRDYVVLFKDWGPAAFSPFAKNYGLRVIVDSLLAAQPNMYFETGVNDMFVSVQRDAFVELHPKARFDLNFTRLQNAQPAEKKTTSASAPAPAQPGASLKLRIEKITELPPMPDMAHKIINLNANPYARVQDLAAIVEIDPSLSAQVIRYARSPFFGYRGRINSVHEAIARVLGYDLVMNIALGLAACAPFKHARGGPLGLEAFWRHATYSAVLMQSLSSVLSKGTRPRQGMAYLAGLLHNFGFVVLGHTYPDVFARLNSEAAAQPDTPITQLEARIVGTPHTEIGAWLMDAWNMPGEVTTVVREHHNAAYMGNFAPYVGLTRLVDHLLKGQDLGDADHADIPPELLSSLGLTQTQLNAKMNRLLESRDELDQIAQTLAA